MKTKTDLYHRLGEIKKIVIHGGEEIEKPPMKKAEPVEDNIMKDLLEKVEENQSKRTVGSELRKEISASSEKEKDESNQNKMHQRG